MRTVLILLMVLFSIIVSIYYAAMYFGISSIITTPMISVAAMLYTVYVVICLKS